jgi:hypothetical protein
LAENAVPTSRKVNNKPLTGNITLNAADVQAYPSPTYFDDLPSNNYVGPFLGGENTGWVKGMSIGSSGGDIGQIWIDANATLYTRFINKGNGIKLAQYVTQSQISQEVTENSRDKMPSSLVTAWLYRNKLGTSNVSQDLGSATDRVMSQVAVTTALNTKQNKGDYATDSALNVVNDNANSRLEKTKNGADIPNTTAFVRNLGLEATKRLAENAVPTSRKINNKTLTGDITLNAGDVEAYPSPTYFDGFPRDNYVGPFLFGESAGWVKGFSIGSSGGDIGQIWIDSEAILHTRFLNRVTGIAQQQRMVSVPIGATIEWQSKAPIPDGFMLNDGRAFDKNRYRELLTIFPNGHLPDDRGLFKRALDSSDRGSRNYDPGRQLGTIQGDAIRNITGGFGSPTTEGGNYGNGAFASQMDYGGRQSGSGANAVTFTFDASRVVPTANENRPVNKSVIYITRVF